MCNTLKARQASSNTTVLSQRHVKPVCACATLYNTVHDVAVLQPSGSFQCDHNKCLGRLLHKVIVVMDTKYTPRVIEDMHALAARHNICLPDAAQVPAGYGTMRAWLLHKIATLEGRHKERWQRVKADPARLEYIRAQNRQRVRAYQARKSSCECTAASLEA